MPTGKPVVCSRYKAPIIGEMLARLIEGSLGLLTIGLAKLVRKFSLRRELAVRTLVEASITQAARAQGWHLISCFTTRRGVSFLIFSTHSCEENSTVSEFILDGDSLPDCLKSADSTSIVDRDFGKHFGSVTPKADTKKSHSGM